ncbi:outer membrane protein [Rhizobium paknamense]|uniref:Outer membrane immunogenic protein n=1 Tax=Rhizobium paknamense TaxID=1206817 RepID=A0ABU0IJ83_9HYPH|nr:outer membrane protein [Rhizobium paknamense]MDQ0458246.1 outer membrane immunogenic protein [Rhizobium paknamense]
MKFRSLALAALTFVAAGPVFAADPVYEPVAPSAISGGQKSYSAYDWSGFYLGVQGGYNWNQIKAFGSKTDRDGGSVGAHAGYNFQSGSIVYGIENDFNYSFDDKGNAKSEWDASGRARVGYTMDRTLIFATAGLAAAGAKADVPASGKKDEILIGWTAGAGIEHALTDHILIRGEYRYSDFGKKDFGGSVGDFSATQHKVVVGASYKF